jgi:hypothetical protein
MRADVGLAILIGIPQLSIADAIPSAQAKDRIGETATVCGRVADTLYQETGSHVTFLNFDKPYSDHTFTAFLPAENRSKFGTPERDNKDKDICVTGKIEDYHGKAEIVLTDPQQIKMPSKAVKIGGFFAFAIPSADPGQPRFTASRRGTARFSCESME